MSRIGKIARLPRHIRTDLNHRLDDGQEGQPLLDWLNQLPLVEQMIDEQFDGVPISPQNLSEWRQGGFREWLLRQELIEQACVSEDWADDLDDQLITSQLPGKLAGLVAARYAALLSQWNGELNPEMVDRLSLLRNLNKDIALLQRTLQAAEKQKREQEKAENDEEQWELEEEKKRATAPMMAKLEAEAMALAFGGGPKAQQIGQYMAAVKHDLSPKYWPDAMKPGSPGKAQDHKKPQKRGSRPVASNQIKPNQVILQKGTEPHDVAGRADEATGTEAARE
jgi:hypothetical protein